VDAWCQEGDFYNHEEDLKNRNQLIKFRAVDHISENLIEPPKPATSFIPEWYKKAKVLFSGETTAGLDRWSTGGATNTTYKACSPFMDSLSMGYIWACPADIEIRKTDDGGKNNYSVRWRTVGNFVSSHSENQHPGLPTPQKGMDGVLKWEFPYITTTPPGYSTMFTHPINRSDLPFVTLTGVVDTDVYPLAVKFPFQLLEFEGDSIIIEKGTPLCQMIPIKRESWVLSAEGVNADLDAKSNFEYFSKMVRAYKSRYWHKKEYR
jgi:hypothetical protein